MVRFKSIMLTIGALSLIFASLLPATSYGQIKNPGFSAKPMIVSTITGVENKEIAIINVHIAPGGSAPHHTHPER